MALPGQTDFGFPAIPADKLAAITIPQHPVWTENKAQLIKRYLRYFVLVTHHGTYVDGFAGPQNPAEPESWAAKLVLESEPRWLRNFFLCDVDAKQVRALQQIRDTQPAKPKRKIEIYDRDFNIAVDDVLSSGTITDKEAAFCLLDQRTFECKWSTVELLAHHKKVGNKIELFYFLAAWWFDRSFAAVRDRKSLREWWGRDDFEQLGKLSSLERAQLVCERLRKELGYKHAHPWPIYQHADGGHIAYYMVHASDHDDAPVLMSRAYRKVVSAEEPLEPLEPLEQLSLEFMRDEESAKNTAMNGSIEPYQPPLEPPSNPEDFPDDETLRGLDEAGQIQAIKEWFHHNFEDPVMETPYVEGEYLYLWGGPFEATDEIGMRFSGVLSDTAVERAIRDIEGEGWEWAPRSWRIINEPDAEDEPGTSEEEVRAEMVHRLRNLQSAIDELREATRGIGHNRPPEPIEDLPTDLFESEETITDSNRLRELAGQPEPSAHAAEEIEARFRTRATRIAGWLGEKLNIAADEAAKEFGKRVGQALGGGVTLACGIIAAKLFHVWDALLSAADAVHTWIESIGLPF